MAGKLCYISGGHLVLKGLAAILNKLVENAKIIQKRHVWYQNDQDMTQMENYG